MYSKIFQCLFLSVVLCSIVLGRPQNGNSFPNQNNNRPQQFHPNNNRVQQQINNQNPFLNQNRPNSQNPNQRPSFENIFDTEDFPAANPFDNTMPSQDTFENQNQNPTNFNINPNNPLPATTAPATTTASPQFLACMQSCPSTNEYNPVCGSDSVNYYNNAKLQCAINCGQNVAAVRMGTCQPL